MLPGHVDRELGREQVNTPAISTAPRATSPNSSTISSTSPKRRRQKTELPLAPASLGELFSALRRMLRPLAQAYP
jgi:hypothetical protein